MGLAFLSRSCYSDDSGNPEINTTKTTKKYIKIEFEIGQLGVFARV